MSLTDYGGHLKEQQNKQNQTPPKLSNKKKISQGHFEQRIILLLVRIYKGCSKEEFKFLNG